MWLVTLLGLHINIITPLEHAAKLLKSREKNQPLEVHEIVAPHFGKWTDNYALSGLNKIIFSHLNCEHVLWL